MLTIPATSYPVKSTDCVAHPEVNELKEAMIFQAEPS